MLPGPDLYFACPACSAPFRVFSLASGNTLDGECWSDGYADYPMLPSPPSISRCHQCSTFFWRADAQPTSEEPNTAPPIRSLSDAELNEALGTAAARPAERELALRLLIWHGGNRDRRSRQVYPPPSPFEPRSPAFRENLERLLPLLDSRWSQTADDDTAFFHLLRAEALRELGRFDEARDGLATRPIPPNLDTLATVIAAGVAAQDTAPWELP